MILTIDAMRCTVNRGSTYLSFDFEPLSKPLYRDRNFTAKSLADITAEIERVAALVAEQNPGVTFMVSHYKMDYISGRPNRSLRGYNQLSKRPHFVEPAKAAQAEGFEQ